MKKKVFSAFALSLALCVTLGAFGCGDGGKSNNAGMNNNPAPMPSGPVTPPVVDIYEGELSESSYDSLYSAQDAYIANEILGKATSISNYSFQDQEMTETELLKIKGDFIKGGVSEDQINSVVKYLLSYTDDDASREMQKIMYFLEMTDTTYRYFTPKVEEGETLTNSYFDSVADNTLSSGCVTLKSTFSMTMVMNNSILGGEEMTQVINQSSTLYITPNAAYSRVVQQASMDGEQIPDSTAEMYIVRSEKDPTKFINAMKSAGETSWTVDYYPLEINFPKISATDPEYLLCVLAATEFGLSDHSYFTKTAFGFTMNTDKEQQFMNDVMSATTISSLGMNAGGLLDTITLQFKEGSKTDFYVQNGALSKYAYDISVDYFIKGHTDPYIKQDMKGTNNYSNYVQTEVTVPADVLNAIAAFEN